MTKLAVASMMRNSECWYGRQIGQVSRFFRQLEGYGFDPHYFVVEGDSDDNTAEVLDEWAKELSPRVLALKCDLGGPPVASVESAARFQHLSSVGNVALRAARDSGTELILWVESDFLLFEDTLPRLLEATQSSWWGDAIGVCTSPVFGRSGVGFYDIWAFEGVDGKRWGNDEVPSAGGARYLPLRAAGSCILFRGEALRAKPYEFVGGGCLPGLCREAVADGLRLFCDTSVRIHHPSVENVCGRLI